MDTPVTGLVELLPCIGPVMGDPDPFEIVGPTPSQELEWFCVGEIPRVTGRKLAAHGLNP